MGQQHLVKPATNPSAYNIIIKRSYKARNANKRRGIERDAMNVNRVKRRPRTSTRSNKDGKCEGMRVKRERERWKERKKGKKIADNVR